MAARVAVLGGGLAGLAAARELKSLGCSVELFERGRLLGGKATSFEVDGVEVDNGQHVYLACCTEFIDFVDRLGMSSSLWRQPRFQVTVLRRGHPPAQLRAGDVVPAPLHLLGSLLRYPHLGWAGRLEVARALGAAALDGHGAAEITFSRWLRRHGRGAAAGAFWEPFLVPALNAPLDEVSAESALFVLRTAFLSSRDAACIGMAKVPLRRIADAAAADLDGVWLRQPVLGLVGDERRVKGVSLGGGRTAEFDALVLALPPREAARVLGAPERFLGAGLDDFRSQPIVDVHLWYEGGSLPELDFAALLDSPVQWVFQKQSGYFCSSLSAAASLVRTPEAELVELGDRELRAALPDLTGARLLRGAATRDPEATFVPRPGLRRPGPATSAANLALAGAWTDTGWPATMESAVRSGRAAARQLAEAGALG
jgi:squalene-associated FAD-dependent desaturase